MLKCYFINIYKPRPCNTVTKTKDHFGKVLAASDLPGPGDSGLLGCTDFVPISWDDS